MPVGDRSLALQADEDDYVTLSRFLSILPRFLRAEVDDLVVRLHPLPSIEANFLAVCSKLMENPDRDAAVSEAALLMTVAFRQLGMGKAEGDNDPPSAVAADSSSSSSSSSRISSSSGGGVGGGSGVRRVEELLTLRAVLEEERAGWYKDLLGMDASECDCLLARFSEMSRSETHEVAAVTRNLDPPGLPELLWLMEHPDERGVDALRDLQRRDHQRAMLSFHAANTNLLHPTNARGMKMKHSGGDGGGGGAQLKKSPQSPGGGGGVNSLRPTSPVSAKSLSLRSVSSKSMVTEGEGSNSPNHQSQQQQQQQREREQTERRRRGAVPKNTDGMQLPSGAAGDGSGYRGCDPRLGRDFMMAASPHKSEVVQIHGMGEDKRLRLNDDKERGRSEVVFEDTLSQVLGVRPYEPVSLDTTHLHSYQSRQSLYQFAALHGNLTPGRTGDLVGAEKLDALTADAERMRAKGRWWASEAENRKVRLVKAKLLEVFEAGRVRLVRTRKARAVKKAAQKAEQDKATEARAKAELIRRALDLEEKWHKQHAVSEQRAAHEKKLFADLQSIDCTDHQPDEVGVRRNDGLSYRLAEWSQAGVPLTSEAASVTFGALQYENRDDEATLEMHAWKEEAEDLDKRRERRRKLKQSTDRIAEESSWAEQMASWRGQAAEMKEAEETKRLREQQAHVLKLEERARVKAEGAHNRMFMRREALSKDEDSARLREAESKRVDAERKEEAGQRMGMSMEEARQRATDNFWGLPTKWAYLGRLEEYKRKIWQARIADRRKRMVQLGEVVADTDLETRCIQQLAKEPWQRDWVQGSC